MNLPLLAVLLLGAPVAGVAQIEAPYDGVIVGGKIVDGTGAAWFRGDLAVRGGRIVRVTPAGILSRAPAR